MTPTPRRSRFSLGLCRALLAGALLLLSGPVLAQQRVGLSDIARGNSFGKGFDTGLRNATVKEVPLVALRDAQVVMANYKEMNRLGIKTPKYARRTGDFDREITQSFAFRPATPDEIAQGKYTHTGIATRYADKLGDGGVKGDGRAALTGEVIVKNRKGAITGVYDIQVKGVGTGLHPNWKGFSHRHGKESLRQAVEDALFSDYLGRNGIRTNSWLAVIDTKDNIKHPDGGVERAGLLVRGGNFLRMAHFNLVRNDPKQLRQLVDFANKQVSLEMGRNKPLSIPGLYKVLTQRKAKEMADMYFLRTVHGSTTYDNIGLVENMDHGTGSTVNRTHKNYSFFSKWVGYGGEPKFVMDQYYKTELFNLLQAAATPAERQAMAKLKPARIADGMLEQQMTYNSLLHAGFSEGDAKLLMKKSRGAAKGFAKTMLKLANTQEMGTTAKMGKGTEVKDPARYDVFGAMNKLAELQVTRKSVDARAKALVKVLRPGKTAGASDLAAAKELVQAFDKVASPVLGRAGKYERVGKVRLMRERATTRNRHAVNMVRQDLRDYSRSVVDRVKKGENLDGIRADLRAYQRQQTVLGPGSSVHAASLVVSGKVPKTKSGYMVLSQHRENGVAIKELSNGKKDVVEVSVAGDPLGLGDPGRYRMHFSVGGDWKDLEPTKVENGKAIFEIPANGKATPKTIQAAFFDGHNRNGRWLNNAGRNFGKNVNLVLGSDEVQTSLDLAARRMGVKREVRLRSSLRAVSKALFAKEKHRMASRPKKKATHAKKPPRKTRAQRALARQLKGTHSAEKFHTFKMKPRKPARPRAKKTTKGGLFGRGSVTPRGTNQRRAGGAFSRTHRR